MIHLPLDLFSAFLLGLFSSLHCVGMCGGLMSAFSVATPTHSPLHKLVSLIIYNMGRITMYTLLGLMIGALSRVIDITFQPLTYFLRLLSGVMLILMGLYLSNWWMGLTHLERAGFVIWKKVQPLIRRLLPANTLPKTFLLGVLWGLLPCGLVYSVLLWALGSPRAGALLFCFGLGTLPALVTLGAFTQALRHFAQSKYTRLLSGLLLILFGVWTIIFNLPATHHHIMMIHP